MGSKLAPRLLLMSGVLVQRGTRPKTGAIAPNLAMRSPKAAASVCFKQPPTSIGEAQAGTRKRTDALLSGTV